MGQKHDIVYMDFQRIIAFESVHLINLMKTTNS